MKDSYLRRCQWRWRDGIIIDEWSIQ